MRDRPTPETDALAEKLIPIAEKITEFNAQSVVKQLLTDILTKTTELERERDEWAERWADLARTCIKDICAMERERDEAREKLSHLRACVFDALSALEAGAFEELKKAWEETK